MESSETDAIAYNDTKVKVIVYQLRSKIRDIRKIYGFQEESILCRLENEYQSFIQAQKKWMIAQKNIKRNLSILQGRQNEEIHRLDIKITRYQILDKYGVKVWTDSYRLAKEHQDNPETLDILKNNIETQIAKDLLDNKLGYWFSQDMDNFSEIISERNPMDMV